MKRFGPPMIDRRLKRKQTRTAVEDSVMGEVDYCRECMRSPAHEDSDFCSDYCEELYEASFAEATNDRLEDR